VYIHIKDMPMISHPLTTPLRSTPLRSPVLWGVLALWFLAIMTLVQRGAFVGAEGSIPFPLAAAATIPPLVYLLAYRTLAPLRAWVAALDLAWIVGAQAWRVIGIVFLFTWAAGDLPSIFALTAGLGDLAVGTFALLVTLAVATRAAGWEGKVRLLVIVGMADFVAAFGTATLSGVGFPLYVASEGPPQLMLQSPLTMIPAFGVPRFIILHLISWQKLHRAA
jgi:hypothetical protein